MSARRGDIEGLRALAVVLVVAYHCGVVAFAGGFVGVDVFFALSGYLMTGLLLDERDRHGRIDLVAFYARRIRRLLPAAAVAVGATLAAGAVILDPLSLRRLAGDVLAVATYTTNLRFAAQGTDYLQSDTAVSPLLHHWSLAVEEQFYLVWPVLLLAATARGRRHLAATVVLTIVAVSSFAASLALTHDEPVWSFFGLHTRAWQFALGGLALIAGRRLGDRAPTVRATFGWVGLGLVVACAVVYDDRVPYPGWRALLPVLGTLLVLDAVVSSGGPRRLLGDRRLVWLGGHSYAIYLWHWPPLILVPVALERALTTWEALGVAAVATVVAVVVQAVVEDPVRRSSALATGRRATYALGAGVTAALLVASAITVRSVDLAGTGAVASEPRFAGGRIEIDPAALERPQPVPENLTPSLDTVSADEPSIYATGCHVDIPGTRPSGCRIGHGRRTIALFGDSHAAQWFPALEVVAARLDLSIVVVTKSGCPAASLAVWSDVLRRDYVECDAWREAAFRQLEAQPPDAVVVASYPRPMLDGGDLARGPRHEAAWRRGTRTTMERLTDAGIHVLVLGPVPRPGHRSPECVAAHLDDVRACDERRADVEQQPYLDIERDEARRVGAVFADTTDWVCDTEVCPAVVGRYLVYRDTSHLTTSFARSLAPLLRPFVERVVGRSAQ